MPAHPQAEQTAHNIVRQRQLALLENSAAPVLLVLAPAGFGKTTALRQWVGMAECPVVWFAFSQRHRILRRFATQLVEALRVAGVAAPALDRVVSESATLDAEIVLDAFLVDISETRAPIMLVFDDVHLVADNPVSTFIANLVEELPGNLRLVLASREPPQLPLARLRVQGRIDVFGVEDLRFDDDEASAFLSARIKYAVSDQVIEGLAHRMEGWPAGLEMAVLAIDRQAPDDFDVILQRFGDDDKLMREYLLQEVLDRQPAEIRSFLLETSICDRFNRDLCQAITGLPDGADLLEEVERKGMFIATIGPSREWYRYHQLFLDFLRSRANRDLGSESLAERHRRAATWLGSNGYLDEAIFHAVASRDWSLASNLIRPELLRLYETDRNFEIADWFAEFPSDVVDSDAFLSFAPAYALARIGRTEEALARVEVAETLWRASNELEGLAAVSFVRGAVARQRADGNEVHRQAMRAIELMDRANGVEPDQAGQSIHLYSMQLAGLVGTSNGISILQLGTAHRLRGESTRAAAVLEELYDQAIQQGRTVIGEEALSELGVVYYQQGRTHQAQEAWTPVIQATNGATPSGRRQALIYAADLHRERNELAAAEELLEQALHISRQTQSTTLLPQLHTCWAHICSARSENRRAFAHLDEAIAAAQALTSNHLRDVAKATQARFWLRQGDIERAVTWARESGVSAVDAPSYERFEQHLALAGVLRATDDPGAAVSLLRTLLEQAEADGRFGDALHIRVAQALAYQDLFELDQAIATIEPALDMAHEAGYARSFLDEGTSMIRLLRVAMRREVTTMPVVNLLRMAGEDVTISRVTHSELVEPISAREVEVLTLIALGLSNKEIAEELYISVSTVKRHITNAYGKLGVSGRTDAVERARLLGVI